MAIYTAKQLLEKHGVTPDQVTSVSTTTPIQPTNETGQPISNKVTEAVGLGGATDVFGRMANTLIAKYPNSPLSKIVGQNEGQKKVEELTGKTQSEILSEGVQAPTGKEMLGAGLQTAAIPAGIALTGGASIPAQVAVGAGLGYAYDVGQDLVEGKSTAQTLTPGVATLLGGAAPLLAPAVGALKNPVSKTIETGTKAVTETIPDSTIVQGAKQKASELVERVPRFVGRVTEATQEQAAKAEKIRTATPPVAQALKVDLPEKYINTVTQADPVTKAAYKRVLDIADETPKTIGVKTNPTIVGGELAGKQYEIIEKQKQKIGQMIGDEVEKLGKSNVKANMGVAFSQIDDVLMQNGITPTSNNTLKFVGKYTPAERARIQELYTLSKESGDVLTAKQVRDMDNLFSKLQRETRMEGIGDLRVNANGQDMSMFRMFRDIYTNQLENIAPEIRPLNAKYRNLVTLTDDIEDSIIKTPNFNVTKSTDPAEFAKVNLRRIFGEAQSSPAYEAIADEMDAISRQLGYKDAKPKDIAAFAQELRELYPESVPRTGFSGGIKSGIADILQSVSQAGKADVEDQRKALRALLDATETQK